MPKSLRTTRFAGPGAPKPALGFSTFQPVFSHPWSSALELLNRLASAPVAVWGKCSQTPSVPPPQGAVSCDRVNTGLQDDSGGAFQRTTIAEEVCDLSFVARFVARNRGVFHTWDLSTAPTDQRSYLKFLDRSSISVSSSHRRC